VGIKTEGSGGEEEEGMGRGVCVWEGEEESKREERRGDGGGEVVGRWSEGGGEGKGKEVKSDFKAHGFV